MLVDVRATDRRCVRSASAAQQLRQNALADCLKTLLHVADHIYTVHSPPRTCQGHWSAA